MRKLITITGPTCTGKSTLEKELNRRGIPSVISYTTRQMRTGETQGVDYNFLTVDEVELLEEEGRVIQKVCFSGNYYGSTVGALEKAFAQSDTAVIVVEPTGVTQFQDYAAQVEDLQVITVFLNNDLAILAERLIDRFNSDNNAQEAYYWRRFKEMREQCHEWPQYTDWNIYLMHVDDGLAGYQSYRSTASTADYLIEAIGH